MFARALDAHGAGAIDARCLWVPGRVEMLGKHTDYAGGRSLLCAAELGLAVTAVPRSDRLLRIVDAASGESAEAELTPELTPRAGHWSVYPFTVAHRVARNFPAPLHGADIAFASDLPQAAGMSSSSALVVATFLALSEVNELSDRPEFQDAINGPEQLAEYLGAVENGRSYGSLEGDRGVGTTGGSEDHTAILAARPNELMQYRFAPVQFERAVPFPAARVLVIAASGVRAEKAGSALADYNRAAARAAAVLEVWRSATGSSARTLAAALDETGAVEPIVRVLQAASHADFSTQSLLDRLYQFGSESFEIIPAAADALARGNISAFGALVDRSQAGAESCLDNQIPETIALARTARDLGAEAASAFGAGFGGSVYALIGIDQAEAFAHRWATEYRHRFPVHASSSRFFITSAGPPATRLDLEVPRSP